MEGLGLIESGSAVSAFLPGPPRRVLHAGCGGNPLPEWLSGSRETRLDIDPGCNPDIVASMTDMGQIGPFEVALTQHCLEHLYPHEVPRALREFRRVLAPGGVLLNFVPDLEDVRPTEDVLFVSPAGPVAGLDLYYGHHALTPGKPHMAHHCGFVAATLEAALKAAGFEPVIVQRLSWFNLLGVGVRP